MHDDRVLRIEHGIDERGEPVITVTLKPNAVIDRKLIFDMLRA